MPSVHDVTRWLPREFQTDAGNLLWRSPRGSTHKAPVPLCLEATGHCPSLGRCRLSTSGTLGLQTAPAASLGPALGSLHQALELALHFRPLPRGRKEQETGLAWAPVIPNAQGCSKLHQEWCRAWQAAPTPTKTHHDRKQDQAWGLSPFLTLSPSQIVSPSVETGSVQGDVRVGVKLALLLHITFTFLWDIATLEKMQQEGRCLHPVLVHPSHPANPKAMLQRSAS